MPRPSRRPDPVPFWGPEAHLSEPPPELHPDPPEPASVSEPAGWESFTEPSQAPGGWESFAEPESFAPGAAPELAPFPEAPDEEALIAELHTPQDSAQPLEPSRPKPRKRSSRSRTSEGEDSRPARYRYEGGNGVEAPPSRRAAGPLPGDAPKKSKKKPAKKALPAPTKSGKPRKEPAPLPVAGVGEGMPATTDRERLPSRLSPSRAKDFVQCPQLFYFKSILRLPTPSTTHTTVGTLAHWAFERVFDHPRGERTPEVAVPYLYEEWERLKIQDGYKDLVAPGSMEEAHMLATAEYMVRNWWNIEAPNRFDPEAREIHLQAKVMGVTLHGFIDRLDKTEGPNGEPLYWVGDYKTGRPASERFEEDSWFAMKVYAVLCQDHFGIMPHELRLIYVRESSPATAIKRLKVTPAMIKQTRMKMDAIWRGIVTAAETGVWKANTSALCNWCHFQRICPAWNPEMALDPTTTPPDTLF